MLMMQQTAGLALFRALGDQTRYRIISSLLQGEKCACELPKLVGRAQPTTSLQLRYLVDAGILSSRRDGRKILYRIKDARVRRMMGIAGCASGRFP
jgi:ArsR family transcriptional regulator, lead/cadmium/zinc/bismuth-responsive transcriptional repressor